MPAGIEHGSLNLAGNWIDDSVPCWRCAGLTHDAVCEENADVSERQLDTVTREDVTA